MDGIKIISLKDELAKARNPQERFSIYRRLWQEAADIKVLPDFPIHLDIELAGICNMRCDNCYQNGYINGPLGLMEFDLYKAVIDEATAEGLCAVKLQIRGESLLHPKFIDSVAYAKRSGVMDVQVTTNATLVTDETARKILDSGLDGIIFSIDEHHREGLKGPKSGESRLQDVESKINNFLQLRLKLGRRSPWVRVQSSIPVLDKESIASTKRYIEENFPGSDTVVINRIHDFSESRDSFPDLHTDYIFKACAYLFQRLAIFWDGKVTVCCMDYNDKFELGDIKDSRIKDIWLGKKIEKMRRQHLNGNRKDISICGHCHASVIPKKYSTEQYPHPLSLETKIW